MIDNAIEYETAQQELRHLEKWLGRLQRDHPVPEKGLTKAGVPQAFACGACGHERFRLTAQFDYWDACDDLLDDELDLPVQDYFCNIIFFGACARCGQVNRILDMDL